MTTYIEAEVSVHNGKPIELYKFEGEYQTYLYTSKETDHIQTIDPDGDFTFTAIAIKRGAMKVGTQDDDKLDLTVELPVWSDLALAYAFAITPPSLRLTIYRIHRDTDELIVYWTGFVTNIKISGNVAVLSTPSVLSSALDGSCPAVWYQSPCNHRLFDPQTCQVPREDHSVDCLAMSTDGREISLSDDGGFPDGYFNAGEILSLESGERRMIVGHVGLIIQVTYPFAELVAGAPVQVTAGCDHDWAGDCATKFNNQLRCGCYGRFVPPDNPFQSGIE